MAPDCGRDLCNRAAIRWLRQSSILVQVGQLAWLASIQLLVRAKTLTQVGANSSRRIGPDNRLGALPLHSGLPILFLSSCRIEQFDSSPLCAPLCSGGRIERLEGELAPVEMGADCGRGDCKARQALSHRRFHMRSRNFT